MESNDKIQEFIKQVLATPKSWNARMIRKLSRKGGVCTREMLKPKEKPATFLDGLKLNGWASAVDKLVEMGLAKESDGQITITESSEKLAEQLRAQARKEKHEYIW